MIRGFSHSSPCMKGRRGLALVTIIFTLSVIAALALASVWMAGGQPVESVYAKNSTSAFYAAQSGLFWARQKTFLYTTEDKTLFNAITGRSLAVGPKGEENFVLSVLYSDPDNDPATSDKVTFTSTGFAENPGVGQISRTVEVTYTVLPPSTITPVFADSFNQLDTIAFDRFFAATISPTAHGEGVPITSVQNIPGGDEFSTFTHGAEQGGVVGMLRVEATPFGDARLMIHTGDCLRWSVTGAGSLCSGASCVSSGDCQAREGVNIAPDAAGFVNYFIKARVRLVSGFGFGLYFRSTYPGMSDPATIDFAQLTGYIWQYDPGMGYLAPCALDSAVPWSDGSGMFFSRRILNGSETCGAGCEIFSSPSGATPPEYPFFCPENVTADPLTPGWAWGNSDWLGAWRTISVYVFQDRATVWVGREEMAGAGGESDPSLTGTLYLDSVGGLLSTGDIGLRVWSGGVVEIDYLAVWENDADHNPATFAGSAF